MKSRRSTRAPLAPLHSNALHVDSPRVQESLAKRETRKAVADGDSKAPTKSLALAKGSALLHKPSRQSQKPSRPAAATAAKALSPAKLRKSVPFVTTILHAHSGSQTARGPIPAKHASLVATTQPRQSNIATSANIRSTAALVDIPSEAPVTAVTAQPANASPGVLSHWHTPGTQPHLDAILTPLDTPAASRRDTMYIPAPKGTPASTVQGAGTPQDFSDVFDLESVSGQTPGGRAIFAGRRDSTPGLILDSPAGTSQQDQERSLHTWLATSPVMAPQDRNASPRVPSPAATNPSPTVSTPVLATPAAAQGLRIKTPPHGQHAGASSLLRSSPFLAQLLRTAPSLSPAPSLPLASPSSASRVLLRVPSAQGSPESLAVSSPGPVLAGRPVPTSSMESAGSNTLEGTASGNLQVRLLAVAFTYQFTCRKCL